MHWRSCIDCRSVSVCEFCRSWNSLVMTFLNNRSGTEIVADVDEDKGERFQRDSKVFLASRCHAYIDRKGE